MVGVPSYFASFDGYLAADGNLGAVSLGAGALTQAVNLYTTLTITGAVTQLAATVGAEIHARTSITNSSSLRFDGVATATAGGTAGSGGGNGGSGGAPTVTTLVTLSALGAVTTPSGIIDTVGADGGAGIDGGTHQGGKGGAGAAGGGSATVKGGNAGGPGNVALSTRSDQNNARLTFVPIATITNTTAFIIGESGSGGGGGGSGGLGSASQPAGGVGGAGGQGGGWMWIAAPLFAGAGVFSCSGTAGAVGNAGGNAAGTTNSGGGGGSGSGGGGAGGRIQYWYGAITGGSTWAANGGAGGATGGSAGTANGTGRNGGTGGVGGNGGAGVLYATSV